MSRKKELKDAYLRRELDDPATPAWRRAHLRARLGLAPELTAADLRRPADAALLGGVRLYVEAQARRLVRQGGLTAFPADVRALYHLAGLGALFESDTFADYADAALTGDDEDSAALRAERDDTLAALRRVGLDADAERIRAAWRLKRLAPGELEALQARYWGDEFRRELYERAGRLLREAEGALLALQAR